MGHGRERRTAERIRHEEAVTYTPVRFVAPFLPEQACAARILDVSADGRGVRLETSRPLFTGRRLLIAHDGGTREAVTCWVRPCASGYVAGASLR